jgi:hypothetical protein
MFVYIIINNINGKVYIGKTVGPSLSRYLKQKIYDVKKGWNGVSHLYNAMKHHGVEHFHIYPLISTLTTNEDLCFYERVLIAQYDSQNPDVGYNICRGGEGFTGRWSESQTEKMRLIMRAKWKEVGYRESAVRSMKEATKTQEQLDNLEKARLPEVVAKVVATKKLRGQTERQREHWKVVMVKGHHGLPKGFRHTEGSKEKMSVSKKGKVPWNKGKTGFHPTEETRQRIRLTMKRKGIKPLRRTV